ncbi:MAG: HlyD family secretion protein [Phycisphaeraceae bacterium]|nr:HlyD family secretion protein [Phycisphaerales bacterium]TVQ79094.1 MAG: HlyD family secretion protein [Phycisphaeraceae bacterium]TVS04833.1 MAG: HlyD family secretion protein [Phycisphaerales bacterium]
MIELLFGIYGLICWLVFKKFKLLPINLWTMVTAVFILLAVLAMGFLWLGRYQPMTRHARTVSITTPIVSEVSGRVIEVVGEGARDLKKGDMLFRIDPTPFEARRDAVAAQYNLAKTRLEQEQGLVDQGAGNRYDLDRASSEVDRLAAELRTAEFQLEATVVRAPADGFVTQVLIRPGQMVTPMAFNQVMVFVHNEGPYMVAGFAQNAVRFIDPGDKAEIAFYGAPGRVFSARVVSLQPVLAEGMVSASGRLVTLDGAQAGRLPVMLEITDDLDGYQLPSGSSGLATVYTGKKHHLNLLRKMIIRIKSWENWVFVP